MSSKYFLLLTQLFFNYFSLTCLFLWIFILPKLSIPLDISIVQIDYFFEYFHCPNCLFLWISLSSKCTRLLDLRPFAARHFRIFSANCSFQCGHPSSSPQLSQIPVEKKLKNRRGRVVCRKGRVRFGKWISTDYKLCVEGAN